MLKLKLVIAKVFDATVSVKVAAMEAEGLRTVVVPRFHDKVRRLSAPTGYHPPVDMVRVSAVLPEFLM